MKDSLIPIRFYKEFMKRDWPDLPLHAQDALANFLMTLQKTPDSPEIIAGAQRDAEGRFGYGFSPGFLVYWRVVREPSMIMQRVTASPERIEVLAVLKTEINLSERAPEAGPGALPEAEQKDLIERVYSQKTTVGSLSMWGTLHSSRTTGRVKGWIVDSWSEGPPYMHSKMHWASFPDYKLHHMQLNIDFSSTMEIGPEDTEIDPVRLVFVHATLRQWEQDWLSEESKKIS
jgi:hypothetical protein